MLKVIVTTTINPVTEAINRFQKFKEWELIVVGDKKTPHELYENLSNIAYLSPEYQAKKYPELSELIGWNCIQRRNIGFIEAYKMGANIVATIDDDNVPYESWGKELYITSEIEVNFYETELICFDPIGVTNYPALWHRGFPLQLLTKRKYDKPRKRKVRVDIQADLWDGDPDIDAICRMEHAPQCKFDDKYFPLATNTFSPFNSQNTFISRDVLKHYFVFPHIGRVDDIWASYYVEALGYNVVYCKPSVFQNRNVQDLTQNLKDEFVGYEKNLSLLKSLQNNSQSIREYLPERSWAAFTEYQKYFE